MAFPAYTPTVPVFLRTVAERYGDREMLVLGDQRLTFREAERRSTALARGLLAAGVGKGTRVALLMPNGLDFAVTWLAAARIGALITPINTFYKARELAKTLRHCDAQLLLCVPTFLGHDYLERLEEGVPGLAEQTGESLYLPSLPYLRAVHVWGTSDRKWTRGGPEALCALADANPALDEEFLRAVEQDVTPADPAIVIYSSGSTAEPKAAVHTQGAILRHPHNLLHFMDLREGDRLYNPMPFFWVGGLLLGLIGPMHRGACTLCEESFEPGRTLELIERERATASFGWPHYFKAMADHPSFLARDLSSLRSGSLLPYVKREPGFDPELRSTSLGMTETCGPHTYENLELLRPEKLRGAFGRPVPGVEHKIVDPETGETLPQGQLGEVCVRGYSLMLGLYKREREETFDADGFYHTGDSGYFDSEGWLFFKGRLGDMIKTGGANVTPREVEVLLESYPEVKEAYVVGVPDPVRGQLVAAAVVPKSGATLEAEALQARLKRELSSYKVPRHLFVCGPETIPLTDSGKIDRRRLTADLTARIRSR